MADDLDAIEPWIGGLLAQMKPAARRKLSLKIGRFLRRSNIKRQKANVEPDGGAMTARKRRKKVALKSGKTRKTGKMFRDIGRKRSLRINASPDDVEVGFNNPLIADTAGVHHYGKFGYVGRTRAGKTVKTKYASRRLLGFGRDDLDRVGDEMLDFLDDGIR